MRFWELVQYEDEFCQPAPPRRTVLRRFMGTDADYILAVMALAERPERSTWLYHTIERYQLELGDYPGEPLRTVIVAR